MARVICNTFGSLGDLHPYLAIAIGLRKRGHDAVIATSEVYRAKVEAEGVEFAPVRPDVGDVMHDPDFIAKVWNPRLGTDFLLRHYILPRIEQSYEDLLPVCRGADLLLTHSVCYAAPVAAEVLRVPWISVALQPALFFSAYDPPVIPFAPALRHLNSLGPTPFRLLMRALRLRLNRWAEPIQRLRERAGLPRSPANPLLEGQFSEIATLALFSRHFAHPQPDWPPNVRVTGFVFYDRQGRLPNAVEQLPEEVQALAHFLASGPPPVLFTLGSSAVLHPGDFYRESIVAVHSAGLRAVLLTGLLDRAQFDPLPDSIHVARYLPFSEIMPGSAAIVHQGGIGTTAQALRSGRPMLVAPWAHDQPDNAERLRKLGVSRTIPRSRYYGARVARELDELLACPAYAGEANEIGRRVATENGIASACDAIEEILRNAFPK